MFLGLSNSLTLSFLQGIQAIESNSLLVPAVFLQVLYEGTTQVSFSYNFSIANVFLPLVGINSSMTSVCI